MAEAKVEVLITARDQASKVFGKVGDSAAGLAKTLTVGIAAGGAAVAAGLGVAIKSASDFEKQMSAVRAVSGASATEIKQLSDLALQLGKDTSFSASQAAEGLEELVKGGVSIPDIMNGAAQATLNLAAAGGVDLATAAEIASNALNTFNLSGSEMGHVADLIAGSANASTIDVSDFALSLREAGSVTKLVGGSFDDLATAITAMGNAGIKGQTAGTQLKTMLQNLTPQTKEQVLLMRELGIVTADGSNKFFDAQGKLRSFADVSQVLQDALRGQTEQQKLSTLQTLFGRDAINAAAQMAELGAEGFQNLTEKIQGISAADVASQRLNNLAGDLEQLSGSAETAGIELGLAFQEPLREATQGLTKFINESVIPFIKEHGPNFAKAVSAAGKSLVEGAGNLLTSAKDAAQNGLQVLRDKLAETGKDLAKWSSEHGKVGDAVGKSLEAVSSAALVLQFILQGNFNAAADESARSVAKIGAAADSSKLALEELRTEAAKAPVTSTALRELDTNTKNLETTAKNLQKILPNLITNIGNVGGAAGEAGGGTSALDGAVSALISPLTRGTTVAAEASAALVAMGDVAQTIGPYFDTSRAAVQTFVDGIDPALKGGVAAFDTFRDNAATALGEFASNLGTTLSGLVTTAGTQAAAIGTAIVDGIRNTVTGGIASVTAAATTLATSALASAKAALGAESPSKEFEEVGDDIVEGLVIGIEEGVPEAEAAATSLGQSVIDAIAVGLGDKKTAELAVDSLKGTVAGAMRDLAAEVEQIVSTTSTKFGDVGRKAGEAVNAAIMEADRGIRSTISDASDRIDDMVSNLSLSRAVRAMRDAFGRRLEGEDTARSRLRAGEDLVRDRAREDQRFQRDLARDIAKATTAEDRAGIIDRAAEQRQAMLERRKEEDEDLAYRQMREDEDRAYRREQDQRRQDFEDSLENQALQRSIARSIEDRDSRIKAINDALDDKKKKIKEDAEAEQRKLVEDSKLKIQTLKDEFIAKLPPLTEAAAGIMDTFLTGIDQGLQSVADMANAATAAIAAIPTHVDVEVVTHHRDERAPTAAPESNLEPSPRGPLMDSGGIVSGPAWVRVGAGVTEAFTPLNRGLGAAGTTVVNVNVYGSVMSENDLVDAVHAGLLRKERSNAGLFRT